MGEMSEAVPLNATLRVQVVDIVIGEIFSQRLDLMLEHLATERRHIGDIRGRLCWNQPRYFKRGGALT
jgi:hypothetical protein